MADESTDQSQVTWKERKKQQLREELVSIALRLFRERGVDSTSVDDIVGAAGVAKGTFYLYFKSKADVVAEAMETLLGELEARIAQATSSAPEDARVTLRIVVRAQLEFLQDNKGLIGLMLPGCGDLPADAVGSVQSRTARVTSALYERIIRTGMLQTHYREVDAHLSARILQAILGVLVCEARDTGGPFAGLELTALDVFEKGIRRGA